MAAVFDGVQLLTEADTVKNDVFSALLHAKDVKLLQETYGEFLLTAIQCYGICVRAQMLEALRCQVDINQLTPDRVVASLNFLAKKLDQEAAKLANQVELIDEVRHAPAGRH